MNSWCSEDGQGDIQRRFAGLLGVDPGTARLDHIGLNHLTWERAAVVDGTDMLPRLLDEHLAEFAAEVDLDPAVLAALGCVPSYYLRYFYSHDEEVTRQRCAPPRGQQVADIEARLLELYAEPSRTEKPDLLMQRGGAYYSEAAVGLMAALLGERPGVHALNVRNAGTLAFLSDDVRSAPEWRATRRTRLSASAADHFGVSTVQEAGARIHLNELDPARLAELTPLLFAVATAGDAVAPRAPMTRCVHIWRIASQSPRRTVFRAARRGRSHPSPRSSTERTRQCSGVLPDLAEGAASHCCKGDQPVHDRFSRNASMYCWRFPTRLCVVMWCNRSERSKMGNPRVVSREEWLVAREALLAKEKELTDARDVLDAARRALPMVRVQKNYFFDGAGGEVSLLDLFDGRTQLITYHFMFDPAWDEGCTACSFLVDNIGHLGHLHSRDTSLTAVSRAPLSKIEEFKTRMGWTIPWVSSFRNEFNYDFHVTMDPAVAPVMYNYKDLATLDREGLHHHKSGEQHGVSVFLRDGDNVFHTYSAYGRGLDLLLGIYNYLDLTPLGRQEEGTGIVRFLHHDRYPSAVELPADPPGTTSVPSCHAPHQPVS